MKKLTRRAALLATGVALGVAGSRTLRSFNPSLEGVPTVPMAGEGMLNDASLLSATPIHRHVTLTEDPGRTLVARIRAELAAARAEGRPLAAGAARHSMGGQSIPRSGIALSFDNGYLDADAASLTYLVHAGARWRSVIAALDRVGLSPKVMQSNNDFGVAATFSVGAHGWAVPFGPMGSTVRAVHMVLPDGTELRAAPGENADLFAMAMGGYGLAGIITEMVVEAVPNLRLAASHQLLPATGFAEAFTRAVADPAVRMAYGRLNVDRARFFDDALLVTYGATEDQADLPAVEGSGAAARMAARLYRAQLGNERLKRLRWDMETGVGAWAASGPVTRNTLLNEPVATLDDRNPERTDILHEYFVAPDGFREFLSLCRAVIAPSYQEMLNVTLRYVAPDPQSVLSYAPVPRIAALMSFSQEMTTRAEADMTRLTREMIDGVIGIGGSYYLPYRDHATAGQFARAYPRAAEFSRRKREIDRALVLRNGLWDNYLSKV